MVEVYCAPRATSALIRTQPKSISSEALSIIMGDLRPMRSSYIVFGTGRSG